MSALIKNVTLASNLKINEVEKYSTLIGRYIRLASYVLSDLSMLCIKESMELESLERKPSRCRIRERGSM